MANDTPAFPFYPRDFLADTVHMTAEEVGAYWLILCSAWNSEQPGYLPNDPTLLQRLGRLNPRQWARASAAIMGALKTTPNGEFLYSKRMVAEREKQLAFREQASAAGKKSAAARAQRKVNDRSTSVEALLAVRSNRTPTDTPTESNSASASASASAFASAEDQDPESHPARARVMDAWRRITGNLVANPSAAHEMADLVERAAAESKRTPDEYITAFVEWVDSCPPDRRPQKAPHKLVENFAAVQEWLRGERKAAKSAERKYKNFREPRPHIPKTYEEKL